MKSRSMVLLGAVCLFFCGELSAQIGERGGGRGEESLSVASAGRVTWKNALMSLLVPGSGQVLAGQERGAIYLVAEAFLLTRLISERNEGNRERNRYRALALNVSRRAFGGAETDTVFEYYDKMGKFKESGPFSTAVDGTLVPPTELDTFNGSIWDLARRTFLQNPDGPFDVDSDEYRRALAFYRLRAIGPNFSWSWRNAGLELDLFRLGIKDSDDAFRRASSQLGALVANHLLSAVDAFISYRLWGGAAIVNSFYLPADGRGRATFNLNVTVGF